MSKPLTKDTNSKCLHENWRWWDEVENEETGEIISGDFAVCDDCGDWIDDRTGQSMTLGVQSKV